MQPLVGAVHPLRLAVEQRQIRESLLHGVEIAPLGPALIVDHRLLETLRQIDAVDGVEAFQVVRFEEHPRIVVPLPVKQIAQFEQKPVAREIIEPINRLQVVARTVNGPVRPVSQRLVGQRLQLIPEIARHEVDHPPVVRRGVVLLQDFQHHHPRPPVGRIVPLEAEFARIVRRRAEIAVLALTSQNPLDPRPDLRLELRVVEQPGQRQQSVDPVRAALPLVAVAAQPAVARPHHLGVELVHAARGARTLPFEHLPEPPLRPDGAQRQFDIGFRRQRRPVVRIVRRGSPGRRPRNGGGEGARQQNAERSVHISEKLF